VIYPLSLEQPLPDIRRFIVTWNIVSLISYENRYIKPIGCKSNNICQKLEKPSSPPVDRSLSQGHPLVVSLDSEMQKRLLAFQVNNGVEDELSASILGYAARAGILREITSQILIYPSVAS